MKKEYWVARAVLVVLTAVLCLIITIHEDGTTKFFVTVVYAAGTLFLSFPAERISQRMIRIGDMIRSGWKRMLYYVGLLAALLLLSLGAYFVISGEWFGNTPKTLSDGLMIVLFYSVAIVAILLPYNLTLIVLFIRKRLKEESENETE
ncbi:MAG: hypothetical protein J5872_06200 [Lachnospiraceae bacterium]|nr:hypothetical protein [Lachnospiraceae bacterium]